MPKGISGLDGRYVHKLPKSNTVPQTGFADQQNVIQLVENRTNEISVPIVITGAVLSREMSWSDAATAFVANPGQPTRVSEFIKQINKRVLGSSALNNTVVVRAETIDAETGNRFVFTPGATVVGSLQDFFVIIPDQGGGYESRGWTIQLQNDANPSGGIDGGQVLIRLNNAAPLPW